METLPTIKISMEGVQSHVASAFVDHFEEIKQYAKKCIDSSMNKLREEGLEIAIIRAVEETMSRTIHVGIREAVAEGIEEYFTEGKGAIDITEAIRRTFEGVKKEGGRWNVNTAA
jgi:hypothetical protein